MLILFNLFAAELLENLGKEKYIYAIGFADDVNIITIGKTTRQSCRDQERVQGICLGWANRHGAKFAPEKYKVIHLTRRKLSTAERQRTPNIGITSPPEESIRILGVLIDQKLKWKEQIQAVIYKAKRMEGALRRITAATWGSPALAGRTIYKATIRSLIAYGCEAWFSKDIAKSLLESLQKTQNSCLRAILGAYKATPLPIIHEDLEMPRIKDYLKQRWT